MQVTECQISTAGDRTITRQSQNHLPFRSSRFTLLWTTLCEDATQHKIKERSNPEQAVWCIFTCLRYRAVHIEVAGDNGTSFRGAGLDVIKTLKVWDQEKIQATLTQRGINWKFNPPAASHQGGVWERLLSSIRRILHSMVTRKI